eukprot:NODE_282_length_1051_cov_197.070858_g240_i0.p1 GENE.NODE_282_length_1051_cov_197.070858_g240_i0~~NODE_282_length_1051_cov_197.070858_g240_i0.p1  ORF type:complete len:194 (+),score=41.68 NODE_282_length_1051_cov_197.070858_g240_i0:61-642(+)
MSFFESMELEQLRTQNASLKSTVHQLAQYMQALLDVNNGRVPPLHAVELIDYCEGLVRRTATETSSPFKPFITEITYEPSLKKLMTKSERDKLTTPKVDSSDDEEIAWCRSDSEGWVSWADEVEREEEEEEVSNLSTTPSLEREETESSAVGPAPCVHSCVNWKRLRYKKGLDHMVCTQCGYKWRQCQFRPRR